MRIQDIQTLFGGPGRLLRTREGRLSRAGCRRRPIFSLARLLPLAALAVLGGLSAAGQEGRPSGSGTSEPPRTLFFDDFDGPSLDTSKWVAGLHVWGRNNRGVVPENLSLKTIEDQERLITVLDTAANGDLYRGPIQGIRAADSRHPLGDPRRYQRVPDGTRVGGLVWTRERWGGGRYEIRMKNLPQSGGCSCIWNYYQAPGEYTEIDIEMPANGTAGRPDWSNWAGLNTYWPDERSINERKYDLGAAQNDGKFHTYRWDWYDGPEGTPRVEFYLDGRLLHTATANVPRLPAQLWVGNWPAVWSGDFNYETQHLYIDWVKITELPGPARRSPPPSRPR